MTAPRWQAKAAVIPVPTYCSRIGVLAAAKAHEAAMALRTFSWLHRAPSKSPARSPSHGPEGWREGPSKMVLTPWR